MGWPAAHLFRANSTGLVLLPTRPFATDDPLPPLPHLNVTCQTKLTRSSFPLSRSFSRKCTADIPQILSAFSSVE